MLNMPTRMTLVLFLTAALLIPPAVVAQVASNDWSTLKSLSHGLKLSVKLKDGKKREGKLESVSDSTLVLLAKGRTVELRREDVATVHQVRRGTATKAMLIGLGAGAATGATIGLAGSAQNDDFDKLDQAVTAGLTAAGAGVGALFGYLIGRSGGKKILIYAAN